MSMGVYARNKIIWIDFYYRSIRCRESLNLPDTKSNRNYAKNKLGEIKNQISINIFNYADHFPDSDKCYLFGAAKKQNRTVKELFCEWMLKSEKRLKAGMIKEKTFKNYHTETRYFIEDFSNFNITNLTKADIEDFIIEYSIGRKAKSVNNSISTLKQVFEYAIEKNYIDKSPMERIKMLEVEQPEIHPFSAKEMHQILEALKESTIYPIVATLFYTGMRTGEVLAMKWENVDFNDNTYHIKEAFSGNKLSTPKTKGSKRIIKLEEPMIKLLKNHKAVTFLRSEYIFLNRYNKPYTSTNNIIRIYWKPALKKLGIPYRILYQCRHTFASLSLLAGDPPAKVSKQLGHTTQQMVFRRYAKYIEDTNQNDSKFSQMVTNWAQEENAKSQPPEIKEET